MPRSQFLYFQKKENEAGFQPTLEWDVAWVEWNMGRRGQGQMQGDSQIKKGSLCVNSAL